MIRRSQLPVYSPLPFAALVRGLGEGLAPGRSHRELQRRLAETYQPLQARLTGSGTGALTLAMTASVREGGTPVIALPAYGCFDLATALLGARARVAFYDVDPTTLGPDWDSLGNTVAQPVDAVVVVHQYGLPVDVPRVRSMLASSGLAEALVIDDAAQGVGGMVGRRPLGASGDLGVLSFGRGKGRTGGKGGALMATTERGHEALRAIERFPIPPRGRRGFGLLVPLAAQWLLARPSLYWIPASIPSLGLGETPFHPPRSVAGMDSVATGVACATWIVSDREIGARQAAAMRWLEALESVKEVQAPGTLRTDDEFRAGWLRFPIVATSAASAARLRSPDARARGVMPGYPLALHRLPGIEGLRVGQAPLPGAEELSLRLFTLPAHSRLTAEDQEAVLRLLT